MQKKSGRKEGQKIMILKLSMNFANQKFWEIHKKWVKVTTKIERWKTQEKICPLNSIQNRVGRFNVDESGRKEGQKIRIMIF